MAMNIEQLGLPFCCDRPLFDSLRNSWDAVGMQPQSWLLQSHVEIAGNWSSQASGCRAAILAICTEVNRRVRGNQLQAKLAHLHEYLFEENGFRAASEDFEHLDGLLLPSAITRRSGVPTVLCVLYKAICDRLGIYCWGVALPGKFICGVQDREMLLIDVGERGRVLTIDEARSMGQGLLDAMGEPNDGADWFIPCQHKHWLTRSLANLLAYFQKEDRYLDVAKCLEMEIALWPDQARLLRDLSLVLARIKMPKPAGVLLAAYLNEPEAELDASRVDLIRLNAVLGA